MKMPKINKLPSGSWRAQVQINGVRKSITGPDKKSVQDAIMRLKLENDNVARGTVADVLRQYIEDREPVLSPSTIRRYRQFQSFFPELNRRALSSLSDAECQRAISKAAGHYSGKTITNAWGFYSSAMKAAGRTVSVRLPPVVKHEHPFLSPDQIRQFLQLIQGQRLEIAILLGLHGLRRSEIFGLRWQDVDLQKKTIRIAGATVRDSDGYMVYKPQTKNASSNRTIPILIPRLAELLAAESHRSEHVVTCGHNEIYEAVNKICKANDLPLIGVHGLRHSFASLCYHLGVSEKVAMRLGGWADYGTMRRIYTHLAEEELLESAAELRGFFGE